MLIEIQVGFPRVYSTDVDYTMQQRRCECGRVSVNEKEMAICIMGQFLWE
jgi:hypothetical protein